MTRRTVGLVTAAAVAVLVVAVLLGAGSAVTFVLSITAAIGFAAVVRADSEARGRSGWGWLLACVFLCPLAAPAFLVLAVADRVRGRRGIEADWERDARPYLLAVVVMVVVASALALGPVRVQGAAVSLPGGSATFSGACSSALAVTLDGRVEGFPQLASGLVSPATAAAQDGVAVRCSEAAGRRIGASGLCLAGALALVVLGLGGGARRRSARRTEDVFDRVS